MLITLLGLVEFRLAAAEASGALGLPGTDGQHRKTQEPLCQEYVPDTDHVVYHIRPKDQQHPR